MSQNEARRGRTREVDGSVSISVNLVDHVAELSLGRVLSERSHDGSELLGGNGSISVCLNDVEDVGQSRRGGVSRAGSQAR